MIHANVAEVKSRLSHFLRLAKSGETVLICERNVPVAELTAIKRPVDRKKREAAFGMFAGLLSRAEIEEATRPMTDEEANEFIEGRY